jgi:hypothetical protein
MHISLVNTNGLEVYLEGDAHNYKKIPNITNMHTSLVNINGLVVYLEGNVHNYNDFLEIALTSLLVKSMLHHYDDSWSFRLCLNMPTFPHIIPICFEIV